MILSQLNIKYFRLLVSLLDTEQTQFEIYFSELETSIYRLLRSPNHEQNNFYPEQLSTHPTDTI